MRLGVNKTLAVDRSPMILAYTLPTRFSLTDDRDIVFLNERSGDTLEIWE